MSDDHYERRAPGGRAETRPGTRGRPIDRPLGPALEHENERAGARALSIRSRGGRTGGVAPLPPPGAAVELWQLEEKHLSPADLAQPGWVVRCAIPTLLQPAEGDDAEIVELRGLVVQVRSISYGTDHLIECDVSNGFALHTAGETCTGRLAWAIEHREGPPPLFLNWTVQRGTCRTTATRSFFIDPNNEQRGAVPAFATHWAIYSGAAAQASREDDEDEDENPTDHEAAFDSARLDFETYRGGPRVQTLAGDELLGALGGTPQRIPPYARHWSWPEGIMTDVQLVFFYEGTSP